MSQYEKYTHHGAEVTVRQDLKGRHREHCLCYNCEHFNNGCGIAAELYKFCQKHDLVTPVWECKQFDEKKTDAPCPG